MWTYERRLQYPVKITKCDPKIAQIIISQYGGPDGEMGASMRYLSQRYSCKNRKVAGLMTDIATEEISHRNSSSHRSSANKRPHSRADSCIRF